MDSAKESKGRLSASKSPVLTRITESDTEVKTFNKDHPPKHDKDDGMDIWLIALICLSISSVIVIVIIYCLYSRRRTKLAAQAS